MNWPEELPSLRKTTTRQSRNCNRSNLQDPRNLYRLGQAYDGKGDHAKAQEFYSNAAKFNSLPALNYAFIRTKAEKMVKKA